MFCFRACSCTRLAASGFKLLHGEGVAFGLACAVDLSVALGLVQGAQRAVAGGASLWRLSLPQTAPVLNLPGEQLLEWGGAQRWLTTAMPAKQVREAVAKLGGHATMFQSADKSAGAFAPLSAPLARIHRELKKSFDPQGLFNPGRLYPEL